MFPFNLNIMLSRIKQKFFLCFRLIQTDEDPARKSVCVYTNTSKDLSKIFAKHDEIQQVRQHVQILLSTDSAIFFEPLYQIFLFQIEGGSVVKFSKSDRARKAVSKYHGKDDMIVCEGFTTPLIALGHNPDIFVVRNVPQGNYS